MNEEVVEHSSLGSMTQLLSFGPQDIPIHYDSTAHSFKSPVEEISFQQYQHFALDISTNVEYNNNLWGEKRSFTIPHQKQHLIKNIWLKFNLPSLNQNMYNSSYVRYKNYLGYRIIKLVQFRLNDLVIDSFTGHFLYLIHQLESSINHLEALNTLTGTHEAINGLNGNTQTIYVPLPLWYSKTLRQYFPLLAISQQKLSIDITFEKFENLIETDGNINFVSLNLYQSKNKIFTQLQASFQQLFDSNNILIPKTFSFQFYYDFIILNDLERDILLKEEQQYRFNTNILQKKYISSNIEKIDLQFNTPIKELIFVFTKEEDNDFNFLDFSKGRLLFGEIGTESMELFDSSYFSILQNYFHNFSISDKNIFSYSFCLNSTIGEPNGAIHFGKLPTKLLEIHGAENTYIHIYARSFNVFDTKQGYGNLEFYT